MEVQIFRFFKEWVSEAIGVGTIGNTQEWGFRGLKQLLLCM